MKIEKRTFHRLVRDCARAPVLLAAAVAGFAVLGAARLALTWLVKLWVEGPIATRDPSDVRRLLAEAALLMAAMFLALGLSRYLLAAANQRLLEDLRGRAAARLFAVELSSVRRRPTGEWISRVFSDAGALTGFVENLVKRLLGDGLVAIGALAMMFWIDFRLAVVSAAIVPLFALLLSVFGRRIRGRARSAQGEIGSATAALTEQVHGLATIKGFRTEYREEGRFRARLAEFRRQSLKAEAWSALLVATVFLGTGAGLLAIVAYGSREILTGRVSQGALLAFCLYALQAIEPMRRLSDVQATFQRALAAADRVYEVIDLEPGEPVGGCPLPRPLAGDLRFERVRFRYREAEPVLEDVTLRLGPGEPVALVSASGGGKSTLARLLVRFEKPQSGRILLDGVDIADLDLAALRSAVCVVEQDVFLFAGPLAENIRYGAPSASREAVGEAARLAGLGGLVASLPRGLDSALAEGGRDLSGGEKQRIALARAILSDPAVLVLDESLAAVDSESEARILEGLEGWLRRRTVLVLAHRLSTVMRFPRSALLEDGAIATEGRPADLISGHTAFARLFADQAELVLPGRLP